MYLFIMEQLKDISSLDDIRLLVDSFYGKARTDELLGPIFNGIIQDRWPEHLDKMYRFWETVLLDNHTYHGSPFWPHAQMPVNATHFDRWQLLFRETVTQHFDGPKASEACWRGEKMAQMFLSKITYYNSTTAIK